MLVEPVTTIQFIQQNNNLPGRVFIAKFVRWTMYIYHSYVGEIYKKKQRFDVFKKWKEPDVKPTWPYGLPRNQVKSVVWTGVAGEGIEICPRPKPRVSKALEKHLFDIPKT